MYRKIYVKGHSKIDKIKILMTNGSLMKVESIAECSKGAFCNTFDLYYAIIGIENQFSVFLRAADLQHTFSCTTNKPTHWGIWWANASNNDFVSSRLSFVKSSMITIFRAIVKFSENFL